MWSSLSVTCGKNSIFVWKILYLSIIILNQIWHWVFGKSEQKLVYSQASTLTFVRLSGTSENWRRTSRSCVMVVRRDKWKYDCPTFWRLFSMIKMCCFFIFTDINFVNNYFNVFENIGFHWSTLANYNDEPRDIPNIYLIRIFSAIWLTTTGIK